MTFPCHAPNAVQASPGRGTTKFVMSRLAAQTNSEQTRDFHEKPFELAGPRRQTPLTGALY